MRYRRRTHWRITAFRLSSPPTGGRSFDGPPGRIGGPSPLIRPTCRNRSPAVAGLGVVVAAVEAVRRPAAVQVDTVQVEVGDRRDLVRILVGDVVHARAQTPV